MAEAHVSGPDEIIHQSIRLKIMAALNALPAGEQLEFTRLKAIVQATDGNLGAHLTTLENANYVAIRKDFVAKKPRTRIAMTKGGRKAFAAHVGYLRAILDGDSARETDEERS
jgi:DNA-binding MarR family transcriptional regulator